MQLFKKKQKKKNNNNKKYFSLLGKEEEKKKLISYVKILNITLDNESNQIKSNQIKFL